MVIGLAAGVGQAAVVVRQGQPGHAPLASEAGFKMSPVKVGVMIFFRHHKLWYMIVIENNTKKTVTVIVCFKLYLFVVTKNFMIYQQKCH